jgi:hypothetical protein
MAGELPVSPEMLNRMTPQQRARFEEAMKTESANAHTTTHKNCMKKQDLENPDFTDKKQCTWTTLESSSTRVKGSASCDYKDQGMKVSGSGEFVAVDQEHVKGNMHMKANGGGREMNTNTAFTSKFRLWKRGLGVLRVADAGMQFRNSAWSKSIRWLAEHPRCSVHAGLV